MQKIIIRSYPSDFQNEVNSFLEEEWKVVPNTHIAHWQNISSGSSSCIRSDIGYFSIVLEKD